MTTHAAYSIDELNRLRDQAYAEAPMLRKAAVRAFWRGIHGFVLSAIRGIRWGALRPADQRIRRESC